MSGENTGWIGIDLDGTLAYYDEWRGADHIGDPIPKMLNRVKAWLASGRQVKIMTARVHPSNGEDADISRASIKGWCREHLGEEVPVTHEKDPQMASLWDDRAVQVAPNSGELVHEVVGVVTKELAQRVKEVADALGCCEVPDELQGVLKKAKLLLEFIGG